jgi:hypothetical protein
MQKACKNCKSTNPELQAVADEFVRLQNARHRADYDNAIVWSRIDAIELVATAASAFKHWRQVKATREAQDLLLAMLTDRK